MVKCRVFSEADYPELQAAIDRDTFHPGLWHVDDFKGSLERPMFAEVFYDEKGLIVFVQYTCDSDKRIRIATVWVDANDSHRNARTIILGIRQAVERARKSGVDELVFSTKHQKLADFCVNLLKFESIGNDDYLLRVQRT